MCVASCCLKVLMEGITTSDVVFGIQASLIEQESVSLQVLANAKNFLQPKHYEAVYMERSLMDRCGWPLCSKMKPAKKRPRYRIAQGSIYDDAGIEHYCSVECMNESKLYIAQLSDESIYHRKLVKEKPITPVKKPPVVPQQPREIIITENKNLNKDVDKFDTQDEPKKPIATAVVERNNSNSTKDNSKKTRQNYHLKNIMEKNKKMNDEEENEKFEYEHQEDFEEDDDDDNYDEAETPDFNQSHGEVVAAEFNSLSDFGKIWNLIMNWVTEETIAYFTRNDHNCEKNNKEEKTEPDEVKIPTVDGQTMDISRRKVFANFTSSYLNELSMRLQLPYTVHNAFYLCAATFNFKTTIPSLSKKLWSQIVLVILLGISQNHEFIEDVFVKLEPALPTIVKELSLDLYTVNLLATLLSLFWFRTGE